MRAPVKLLGFVFWLFNFHFAQCQDCLREAITHKDIELVEKPSYKHGERVKVSCMTGFTGIYILQCEKGQWKTTLARQCTKKKCSYPGDTPNGEFKLLQGSEFVFGATVVYTCNKGFEMTSRINHRTCRSEGWDNTLPVCEVVKCPHIRTAEGVTAVGNTEEGKYGDSIHFECVSSDKMLDGRSDVNCTEMGEWSGSVPTCKDITCTAPVIPNGFTDDRRKEYRKDAILQYRCSRGFKRREGNPRCSRFGWTPNPECNEVTCELKSPITGVRRIKPAGKTFFRAGERVEITCVERNRIFGMKENDKSFTCKENGEWDDQPGCLEFRCEKPRDQNVYWPRTFFRGDRTLGAKHSYSCLNGFYTAEGKIEGEATCTRAGWTPNPLCVKQKLCPDLSVGNGFIHNRSSTVEKAFYSCNEGYKPFSGNWWDSVMCINGSWTEEPLCIPEKECGAFPSVDHGKLKQSKKTFRNGETTAFECDPGFKSTNIKCVNGKWETPVCEVGCGSPPKVGNAVIISDPKKNYVDGSSVTYACRSSFSTNGKDTVFCRNGTWEETPTCKEFRCGVPRDQHVRRPDFYFTGDMKLGARREYYCWSGYQGEATCTRDGWKPNPLCEHIS